VFVCVCVCVCLCVCVCVSVCVSVCVYADALERLDATRALTAEEFDKIRKLKAKHELEATLVTPRERAKAKAREQARERATATARGEREGGGRGICSLRPRALVAAR
jgi:hypothetical protein